MVCEAGRCWIGSSVTYGPCQFFCIILFFFTLKRLKHVANGLCQLFGTYFLHIEVVKTCCQFHPKPKTQVRDLPEAAYAVDSPKKTHHHPKQVKFVVKGEKKNLPNFWLGTSGSHDS